MAFLGLTVKAGNLTFGYSGVKDDVEKSKIKLVLFASDLSSKSKEKMISFLERKGIEHIGVKEKMSDIFDCTGKYSGVLGVKNDGMASRLKELNEDRSWEGINL